MRKITIAVQMPIDKPSMFRTVKALFFQRLLNAVIR
jgi:hypothetical protein